MNKIENAVAFAERIARDDSHGYDQKDRWGNPDYDCSGLVIDSCQRAGIPVKNNGATYTGNMYSIFKKTGFKDVTKTVNLVTGEGLKRGDVLLRRNHHTAFYCGNGRMVHARINEKGTIIGGKKGDQTGHEIEISNYADCKWTDVLRYEEAPLNSVYEVALECIAGRYGNGAYRRQKLTQMGYNYKEVQAEVNKLLK